MVERAGETDLGLAAQHHLQHLLAVAGAHDQLDAGVARAEALEDGIKAVAIVFMHAWKYPAHEARVAELAREAGFTQVSTSHAVSPLLKLVPLGVLLR